MSDDSSYCLVRFMYSEGPSSSFHLLQKGDVCGGGVRVLKWKIY
jgi:hypothetical protein